MIIGTDLGIWVYGQIIAVGTQDERIVFKGLDESTLWDKIYIRGYASSFPSEFSYCDFSDA